MTSESKGLDKLLAEWAQLDAELERHQRLVTVMFTDIAGSTRYFDEYGDLAGMAMLTAVNSRLQPVVQRRGGTVVKTIGDAIMAYFEDPVAAVRAGMEMQRTSVALTQERKTREPVRIRVALNLGVGLLKDNDVFGDVVNVCSRIEHETEAGRIGVSPSVVQAVRGEAGIACRQVGRVALRGKKKEMDLYEILWREEDFEAGVSPPQPMSSEQLALATGLDLQVGEDARAALAGALKSGAAAKAAAPKRFVLVEEQPGGALGRRFPLVHGRLLAGRDPGDVFLSDVSSQASPHALFSVLGGALYVEDLGVAEGVFVRLRRPHDLQDGDTLSLGKQLFGFRLVGAKQSGSTAPHPPAQAELVTLMEGERGRERLRLQRGATTLGRTQGTYTFPDDRTLSRSHARVRVHGSYCVLEDLNSTNGTLVRIRGRQLLDIEDTVVVGQQRLRVQAEAAPVEAVQADGEKAAPAETARAQAATPAALGPASLAVLEFQNLSGDSSLDWLGTGMVETLTADLKKLKLVRVIGRERTQQVLRRLGAEAHPTEVGGEVGARWVVTGSFQRAGERIRITPHVLEVGSGDVVASSKVDGKWDELFSLQDRVVVDLLAALEVKLDPDARQRIAVPPTRELEAYEAYAEGRKKFFELGKNALEEARKRFERAVELDSGYAMAYSALGATHAMRFVHRTEPEDLARALECLERAVELDSELGEPYPWLCYIYSRQGKFEQAIRAGLKGAELQPDLVQAHYFLGCAYVFTVQAGQENWRQGIDSLLKATEVEPRWTAAWLVLSAAALAAGRYDRAEQFARQAEEIDRTGGLLGAFPGAPSVLLGGARLRCAQWEQAQECYRQALETLPKTDHMYRDAFVALSACGLGDVALRRGQPEAGLAEFGRAWRTLEEFPRMLGNERVRVRTLAGMAAAHALKGERERARESAQKAAEALARIADQPQTWIWEADTARLCHALAIAQLNLGESEAALELLEKAVAAGWRDAGWLESDLALASLREQPRFRRLLEELRQRPALKFEPQTAAV